MASLQKLRMNTRLINEGTWIEVGLDDETYSIRIRGFTQAYRNRLYELRRIAARTLNRSLRPGQAQYMPETLPPTEDDTAQGQALAEELVLDVKGLEHEPGGPAVTIEEYREMLQRPADFPAVIALTLQAAMAVTADRSEDKEAAAGN